MKKVWLTGLVLTAGMALSGIADAQIVLGVGAPITGDNAIFGAQIKNGAMQAVADIDAAGGILGQKVTIDLGDDVSDPKQGVSVANKFVGDGVKFVVGHFNSAVSIAASEVYEHNGILEITPASTSPQFTERNMWNTFRTCGRDDQQGAVAGTYIANHFKGKNIVILDDKTPYGKGLADLTKKTMNSLGVHEVLYEGINPGEKDYSAVVSQIKQANADLVYWGGLQTEAGLIVRQMRDQGIQAVLMSGDGIATAEYAESGGPGVVGTLMTFGPDPTNRPAAAAVVKEFTDKGYFPEAYTLYAYAAVQIIEQAAEKANSLDPQKVAAVMHSGITFDTVIGPITYDSKGDRKDADYVMYVWKQQPDGKISYQQM